MLNLFGLLDDIKLSHSSTTPWRDCMILITGATGNIGRQVAELLSKRGETLRLMGRHVDAIPNLAHSESVVADYGNPALLDKAFEGVDHAFIVSGYAEPGQRAQLHRNAFQAASRAGVRSVTYLSFLGASPQSKFPMSRDHFLSEQYLKETGIPFTILRDSLYLDLIPEMFNEAGVMRGPAGTGSVAWVSREDVANVVATALDPRTPFQGTYNVTGPEILTLQETARQVSLLVGRELRYEDEPVEEGRKWRSTLGAPTWEVDTWLGSYEAIAAGELNSSSGTVLQFTGDQPLSLSQYFVKHPKFLDKLR
jgi:NAD(P)H dehydrogenase (quinone)